MPYLMSANDSEKLDVELFFPGDRFPVTAGPGLLATGWRGGLWVMYVPSTTYDFTVEVSDGNEAAGFILFQSEDYDLTRPYGNGPGSNANFISYQPATGVGGQNVVTMINGGTRAFFKVFETRRIVAGARTGVPIVYTLDGPGSILKVSENGLLCNDSNADLATVGIANPIVVGKVSAVPSARNGNRLCMDMKY